MKVLKIDKVNKIHQIRFDCIVSFIENNTDCPQHRNIDITLINGEIITSSDSEGKISKAICDYWEAN